MLAIEKKHYLDVLVSAADLLTKDVCLPIDVVELCGRFRLGITRHKDIAKYKARLVQTREGPEIRLPTTSKADSKFSHFERFLLAHELGHFILVNECNASPIGVSEYWQYEDLCDHFASILLLPDRLIEHDLYDIKVISSPRQILYKVEKLARCAQVTELIAAKRVCMVNNKLAIFHVARSGNEAFQVTQTALLGGKERRRKIKLESRLGRALSSLTQDNTETKLGETIFDDGVIPSCVGARDGVAILQPSFKIIIAACMV